MSIFTRVAIVLAVVSTAILGAAPASTSANVFYTGHVQDIGWQQAVWDGQRAGTTGRGLRLEAIRFTDPSIIAQGHVQGIGWQSPSEEMVGTTGKGLRLEAVRLRSRFDGWQVRCQAHVQGIGWMAPVGDGQVCGTAGRSLRLEAVRIWLEPAS